MNQVVDRAEFIKSISEKLNSNGKVIIIDPLDEKFQLVPTLPSFNKRLNELRNILSPNKTGRKTNELIEDEMNYFGFKLIKKESYFVPSLLPGYKEKYYKYMIATSKILGNIGKELHDINNWYNDSQAYAQMGMFMYLFEKE